MGGQASPVPLLHESEDGNVRRPKPKDEMPVWICKMPVAGGRICGHRGEGPWEGRTLSSKNANHLANRHAGEGTLAKRVDIIDANLELPAELRSGIAGFRLLGWSSYF